MQAQLIALDWGPAPFVLTNSAPRALCWNSARWLPASCICPQSLEIAGVLCTDGFELAFDSACGDWLDAQPGLPVIACGMVGSAQGWSEAAYRSTPVDVASLGQALHGIRSLRGVQVHIVPGVIEQVGLPNVMRGEETQVLGVLQGLGPQVLIGLPGSHSKWVEVVEGRITHFDTFMTGEVFAVLSKHSILGRTQQASEQFQADAFDRGVHVALSTMASVACSRPCSVPVPLGSLRSWRPTSNPITCPACSLAMNSPACQIPPNTSRSSWSALLHCARYQRALALCGFAHVSLAQEATERGLWQLAQAAGLIRPVLEA